MSKAERHNLRNIGQFAEGNPRPLQERVLKDETNSEGALVELRRDGEPRLAFQPSLVLRCRLGFLSDPRLSAPLRIRTFPS